MPVGIHYDKVRLDQILGNLAQQLHLLLDEVEEVSTWLAAQNDPDLVQLGYSPQDINDLRGAIADLVVLAAVFKGNQAVPAATDLSRNARKLWGMGRF